MLRVVVIASEACARGFTTDRRFAMAFQHIDSTLEDDLSLGCSHVSTFVFACSSKGSIAAVLVATNPTNLTVLDATDAQQYTVIKVNCSVYNHNRSEVPRLDTGENP